MSERAKFEVIAVLAKIATFASPILIALAVHQFNENRKSSESIRELMVWKSESSIRIKTTHDSLKMELLGVMNQTVGGQYLDIQKQLVRMQTQLETLTKNQDRRDERDERNNASASR